MGATLGCRAAGPGSGGRSVQTGREWRQGTLRVVVVPVRFLQGQGEGSLEVEPGAGGLAIQGLRFAVPLFWEVERVDGVAVRVYRTFVDEY